MKFIIQPTDRILITGAGGFIGRRLVRCLLEREFRQVVCLTRPSPQPLQPTDFAGPHPTDSVAVLAGNLLSPEDCRRIIRDVQVVYHLAAGTGEKSYSDAYLNSVVTTRNLLEACRQNSGVKRFVNVSSFAVYSTTHRPLGRRLDETWPVEKQPLTRGQAYCYAKVRQDEWVEEYGRRHQLPYVHVRPGAVYGPGKAPINGRVGLGTFGLFLHLGGGNHPPFTYVDNCAEAIALAGLVPGVDGEVFNVVDDEPPTSRQFLRRYKREVRRFSSLYVPHFLSYLLCWAWENYASWSCGQLPPVYNRNTWRANWKRLRYSNAKLKARLGWRPVVPTAEGLSRYFAACRASTTP
ncbi:MAG TPA: NAD(P)-dependent oxidoreductase [Verrucomicrobiota bacterium]|nr:MAG: dTDP-glucose 4,6-dehydratase [Candidatus Cloacimonetes bacterium ADurb.Bin117]HPY31741.1 NAD(P)-dependent oxidoreductase [Verrucomicrobiota bacterium]HQB18011.1 NAD(P)-dependent oxidoreductase [Verrucomicrobiota bacterium]